MILWKKKKIFDGLPKKKILALMESTSSFSHLSKRHDACFSSSVFLRTTRFSSFLSSHVIIGSRGDLFEIQTKRKRIRERNKKDNEKRRKKNKKEKGAIEGERERERETERERERSFFFPRRHVQETEDVIDRDSRGALGQLACETICVTRDRRS